MIFELGIAIGLIVVAIAFLAEYSDSTIGMGYGTTLAPVLLLFGFKPLQVVPAVLLSQLAGGAFAALLHHRFGNVNFSRGGHFRIALVLASSGIIGALSAVFIALRSYEPYLSLYIGALVIATGVVILLTIGKDHSFSWKKIVGFGFVASFNKGIAGGGYGPLAVTGQLLSGVNGRNAIGITALAESFVCIIGLIGYTAFNGGVDWALAPYLLIGSVASVPFSTMTVKRLEISKLRALIGSAAIILGTVTVLKVVF